MVCRAFRGRVGLVRLYLCTALTAATSNSGQVGKSLSRRRHIPSSDSAPTSMAYAMRQGPSGPQPTSTIIRMCASPGIAPATCAPDSHHLQLSAVLVRALGSYFASPHAKAMAMQVSRARGTQWYVGSAANALARTTLARSGGRRCKITVDASCRR